MLDIDQQIKDRKIEMTDAEKAEEKAFEDRPLSTKEEIEEELAFWRKRAEADPLNKPLKFYDMREK